jgi:transcriptional regulator with XRE-family HTH domain
MQAFGAALAAEMASQGDNQITAASKAGVAQASLSAVTRGRSPSLSFAVKIMRVYPRLYLWLGAYLVEADSIEDLSDVPG